MSSFSCCPPFDSSHTASCGAFKFQADLSSRGLFSSTVISSTPVHVHFEIGVTMGVITCLGHIAADSAHSYCLCCVSFTIIAYPCADNWSMSCD
ncbi:hypothetical protein CIPAW_06G077300 [Carya illinoinensis]|uniref:Uncharacterized protein n=1 Tax=Carya illinoinensis TaxID=32201 RepID=A0A8T1Q986_CARIL|nr:hypothetical protein CIPAW_06G077300 [Carya illinoinensis]KAG6708380.1 hypothetical protein I3842_06G078200 [Carya illinoinensis]